MDLRELVNLVEEAKRRGARGVEFLYTADRGHALAMVGGRPSDLQSVHDETLMVRAWLDGGRRADRAGAPSDVLQLIDTAVEAAAAAPEDVAEGPMGRLQSTLGGLSIRDRRFEHLTFDDRAEVLLTAVRGVRQVDAALTMSGFRYADSLRVRRFANSRGVGLEETSTTYRAQGTVAGAGVVASDAIASRSFASIASLPYGTALGRRVMELSEDGLTLDQGSVRVLLPARAVARLFGALGECFVQANLETPGAFFLQPEGVSVDRRLHLVDDGTLSGGLRSRSFDDRGVAPIPLTLLREGQVDGRFIGTSDARRLEVRATGHRMGQVLEASNLVLKSGTRSANAILSDLGGLVLMVDDFADLSGLDTRAGHLTARINGVILEANQPVGAIRGATLRGDLEEVLNSVVEVCSDTDRVGHVDAPALVVDGFTL